jgi:hypothetical protein
LKEVLASQIPLVTPVINGNELHWTLKNLGENFKFKLRYTVMVKRPDAV